MPNKKKVLNLTEYAKIIIIQKIIKKEQKIYHEKKKKDNLPEYAHNCYRYLSEDENKKKNNLPKIFGKVFPVKRKKN